MATEFELADSTDVFTFWLGDGPKGTPKLIWKAVVDRDALTQFKEPEFVIPTRDIRSLHKGLFGSRSDYYWASGVTLTTDTETYELWPVNPMKPHPAGGENNDETVAFYDVVASLWQHRKPHYAKDPYIRQHVASRKRMRHGFDGNVSPMVYFNQGILWSRPARMEILIAIISSVVVMVVCMSLVAVWFWLFGR